MGNTRHILLVNGLEVSRAEVSADSQKLKFWLITELMRSKKETPAPSERRSNSEASHKEKNIHSQENKIKIF